MVLVRVKPSGLVIIISYLKEVITSAFPSISVRLSPAVEEVVVVAGVDDVVVVVDEEDVVLTDVELEVVKVVEDVDDVVVEEGVEVVEVEEVVCEVVLEVVELVVVSPPLSQAERTGITIKIAHIIRPKNFVFIKLLPEKTLCKIYVKLT
jgi:hypothetical protein